MAEVLNLINNMTTEYKRSIRKTPHDILTPIEHEEFTKFLETRAEKVNELRTELINGRHY